MQSETQSFRLYLQEELVKRCKQNPQYSLRAFAKILRIEPSALSKILNGKRNITYRMLRRLSERLALPPDQVEKYASLISNRSSMTSAPQRVEAEEGLPQYNQLTLDIFRVIADWYHFAILELTQTGNFVPNPKWIAKSLGITVNEANIAIERLKRLEFLEIGAEAKWKDQSGALTTLIPSRNSFTTVALRKLQKQILEKAILALEEIPIENRDQTSMTMAIDSKLLPEAKQRITRFRRSLCDFLKGSSRKDHVYHVSISLYPVTQIKKEN